MTKKNDSNTSKLKILLMSHYATYSMQDLLYEYLSENNYGKVTKINVPLPEIAFLKHIEITTFQKRDEKIRRIKTIISPAVLAYPFHAVQIFILSMLTNTQYDVCIAQNSLLACIGLLGKKFKKCKKVIYYSHGVAENRFQGGIINKLYKKLDSFAATQSDAVWVLSKEMLNIRSSQGINKEKTHWVPTAINIKKLKRKTTLSSKSLVFIGTLNEMNGVRLIPIIVSYLIKKHPDLMCDIIGDGPLLDEIKSIARNENVESHIRFLGVLRFKDYASTLTNYALGLAPYKPSTENLLQLTDPMKLRIYTASGLPIVTTDGFPFSQEVKSADIGEVVSFKSQEIARVISYLLADRERQLVLRKNALEYSKQFDQNVLYKQSILSVI